MRRKEIEDYDTKRFGAPRTLPTQTFPAPNGEERGRQRMVKEDADQKVEDHKDDSVISRRVNGKEKETGKGKREWQITR